jgi:hypothetical protein
VYEVEALDTVYGYSCQYIAGTKIIFAILGFHKPLKRLNKALGHQ